MKALRRILNSKGMINTHAPDFLLLSSTSQLFHLHPGSFPMSSLRRGETSLTQFWVLSTYKWWAAKLEMDSLDSAFNRSEEILAVGNSLFLNKDWLSRWSFLQEAELMAGRLLCFFSSVQSLSHVQIFVTPWPAALHASLSMTNSRSLLKLMFTKSVMPSNHLFLCRTLLLLPSILPTIRVFSNESVLSMRHKWNPH